jgi:hypothetical protein
MLGAAAALGAAGTGAGAVAARELSGVAFVNNI